MDALNRNPFAPTDRMLRQFAALLAVFFVAIAARQEFHQHRHTIATLLAALALTVAPLGLVRPRAIRPLFIASMAVAYPIGWVVSRLVLGVIFYGLFTPVAWLFRLAGRDALLLKPKPRAETYWSRKPSAANPAQYLHQF